MILTLMSLKYSIKFTVAFSKNLNFYNHKKSHIAYGNLILKQSSRKQDLINMLVAELVFLVLHLAISFQLQVCLSMSDILVDIRY